MSANQNEKERPIEGLIKFINSNRESQEMKRALAVKLALQGYVYRAIENILNVSQGYVIKWKKRFITQGIPGLRLGYRGAKTKLTREEEESTIQWLSCQESWDISELEIYLIEEYDVIFESKKSYYKIYRKAKISRQKTEKLNPKKKMKMKSKKAMKKSTKLSKIIERK